MTVKSTNEVILKGISPQGASQVSNKMEIADSIFGKGNCKMLYNTSITRSCEDSLLNVLPADERNWEKWFGNPYYPDGGGDGKSEDDGVSWLLAYWIGRYHDFIN